MASFKILQCSKEKHEKKPPNKNQTRVIVIPFYKSEKLLKTDAAVKKKHNQTVKIHPLKTLTLVQLVMCWSTSFIVKGGDLSFLPIRWMGINFLFGPLSMRTD